MASRRAARRRQRLVLAFLAFVLVVAIVTPAAISRATPLGFTVHATNGEGSSVQPGRPCDDGGEGAYWHYDYGTALTPGNFSKLPGELRAHLDLHSDVVRFPNTGGAYPAPPGGATAFLLGTESHVSLLNDRGSLKVRLASGHCDLTTLAFDGSVASGAGTWAVDAGAGAYENATGQGAFDVTAEVNPGADNVLDLRLNGAIEVLQPSLDVEVVETYWGQLGLDYLSRRVTVVYRITNTGPGDTYGARLTAVEPRTSGVTRLGLSSGPLGDLAAGESELFRVRWQLGLLDPCNLVLLGCTFQTRIAVDFPDALDVPNAFDETVTAQAPLLPPPL